VTDIQGHAFVLLDETHCLSDTIISFCRQRSFQPVTIEHTSQLATVEELVALGHGVSLIPQMARNIDGSPRRVYRSLSGPKPKRQIVLVWNPYRFQSRVLERFRECVRRAAAEAGGTGKHLRRQRSGDGKKLRR
jgi:LysR family hydrogen peroxide-inducible transcriptional activator